MKSRLTKSLQIIILCSIHQLINKSFNKININEVNIILISRKSRRCFNLPYKKSTLMDIGYKHILLTFSLP